MKWTIFILVAVLLIGSAPTDSIQLMFIYTDNKPHEIPADVARIPVIHIETGKAAYAGATWIKAADERHVLVDGRLDVKSRLQWSDKVYSNKLFVSLSQEKFCIAWDVRSSDNFDQFLKDNGYKRAEVKDETIEVKEISK